MKVTEHVESRLDALPERPGCYIMKNELGNVIYIGKAKLLTNRVRSYFRSGTSLTRQKQRMVSEVRDIEWIVTDSEREALILERNLINKHKPPYNVMLRDDKSYPYIVVTLADEFPTVRFARKTKLSGKSGARYFGPYTDHGALHETLKLIRQIFKVPCGYRHPETSNGKACMYYHIGQCTGVCAGKMSREDYMAVIEEVMAFLEGKRSELVRSLTADMEKAAENLLFEKAAKLRDRAAAVKKLTTAGMQVCQSESGKNRDAVVVTAKDGNAIAEVLIVRDGILIAEDHYPLTNISDDDSENYQSFLKSYYALTASFPDEVLIAGEIDAEDAEVISDFITQRRGKKVIISTPQRGERKALIEMALRNAEDAITRMNLRQSRDEAMVRAELTELQSAINSPKLPRRIEGYDISNTQGHQIVASLVVFEDGKPKKKHYRKFKIRRPDGAPDDYASMREAILRRVTGSLRQTEGFEQLPDLILIDGGKGQLSSAVSVLEETGEFPTPIIGLAKRNEEIYKPHSQTPIILPRTSKALRLLQRVRDESHRFAITYHKNLRAKHMKESILDNIEGIGPGRRKALMRAFGSLEKMKKASAEEIAAAGVPKNVALRITEILKGH